jgi:hypothetical protein
MTGMTPGLSATKTPHHPELAESHVVTPPNPLSQGLGSSSEVSLGGDLEEMPQEIPHQRPPAAESLIPSL